MMKTAWKVYSWKEIKDQPLNTKQQPVRTTQKIEILKQRMN